MNLLPRKSAQVIQAETDSMYFHGSLESVFIENVNNYRGSYPCIAFGKKLGNMAREKSVEETCYYLWKKMYKVGDTMKIKGIPKTTLLPDGTRIENLDENMFEQLSKGRTQTIVYSTLLKNLGRMSISTHRTSRTISCKPVPTMTASDF
jgi:hypothetical protein